MVRRTSWKSRSNRALGLRKRNEVCGLTTQQNCSLLLLPKHQGSSNFPEQKTSDLCPSWGSVCRGWPPPQRWGPVRSGPGPTDRVRRQRSVPHTLRKMVARGSSGRVGPSCERYKGQEQNPREGRAGWVEARVRTPSCTEWSHWEEGSHGTRFCACHLASVQGQLSDPWATEGFMFPPRSLLPASVTSHWFHQIWT